jgi:hypothetical protein
MPDWKADIGESIDAFFTVASLARSPLTTDDVRVEFLSAPHKPPSRLPSGKMAVYAFWFNGEWLKIGMAGPNSNARYTSQHYSPNSAMSTLAKSLQNDPEMARRFDANTKAVGEWMRANCNRVNILLDARQDRLLLAMLEAFLHLRLKPRYERSSLNLENLS